MARISTYIVDGTIVDDDKVIGSDANNDMVTKNYKVGDLVAYFAVAIGDYLVPYNNATNDVDLGPYSLFATNLSISGTFIADGTEGLPGQVLISQGSGSPATWGYNIGSQDLEDVLNNGNTGNKNILLGSFGSTIKLDVESTIYGSTAIQLYNVASGNTSYFATNEIGLQDGSQTFTQLIDRTIYSNGTNSINIVGNNYNNQTFIYPNYGGAFVMSVNGVFADMSGNVNVGGGGGGGVNQVNTSAPLTGGPITNIGTIGITQADSTIDGYLSSADWNTFNSKLGSVPNLQQVTGVDNDTTDGINLISNTTQDQTILTNTYVSVNNDLYTEGITIYKDKIIFATNDTNDDPYSIILKPKFFTGFTSDQTIYLPQFSGTLPISVNGNYANIDGAITIPVGGAQDLQSVLGYGRTENNGFWNITLNEFYNSSNDNYVFKSYNYDKPEIVGELSIGNSTNSYFRLGDYSFASSGYGVGFVELKPSGLKLNNTGGSPYSITIENPINYTADYTNTLPKADGIFALSVNGQIANDEGEITIPVGTGTVTSVDLSMPAAFTVSNNPVINAGTLTVVGAGTVSQLIDGTGALQSIPTSLPPNGTAGGDLQGTYPNPTVHQIQGKSVQSGNPADKDLMIWDNSASQWKHQQITTITGYNNTNWDTAYTDRNKWDGGATGLVAATGRTSLGATTVGSNLFTLTNPSAITFLRVNADNTISTLDAATFRTAIGAGTSSTTGTVTSVAALTLGTSGTDLGSTVANGTTTPIITLNVPTASASNRGALSAADWTTFNGKQTDSAWVDCSSNSISGWASTTTKLMQYKLLGSKTMIFQFSIVGTGTSGGTASITLPFTSSTWGEQTNIIRSRTTATLGIGISTVAASSTTLNVYPSAAMSTWNINAQRDAHGTIIINLA